MDAGARCSGLHGVGAVYLDLVLMDFTRRRVSSGAARAGHAQATLRPDQQPAVRARGTDGVVRPRESLVPFQRWMEHRSAWPQTHIAARNCAAPRIHIQMQAPHPHARGGADDGAERRPTWPSRIAGRMAVRAARAAVVGARAAASRSRRTGRASSMARSRALAETIIRPRSRRHHTAKPEFASEARRQAPGLWFTTQSSKNGPITDCAQ